jgi:hypothetical protein
VPDLTLTQAVSHATEDVLSTMFFTMADEAPSDGDNTSGAEARVMFRGHSAGTLAIWCSSDAMAEMTANFLGLDSDIAPSEAEQEAVLTELANMICGAVLSRIGNGGLFELLPLGHSATAVFGGTTSLSGSRCVEKCFSVGLGYLRLTFLLDDVP